MSKKHNAAASRAPEPREAPPLEVPREINRDDRAQFVAGGRKLPPMASFENVLIQRPISRASPGVSWPDFDRQIVARHFRAGQATCELPPAPTGPLKHFHGEAVFIGPLDSHFGHICAETAPRIPQSQREFPDLPMLLSSGLVKKKVPAMPGAMAAVLDWFGVSLDRVKVITQPTVVGRLHVAAQAEHNRGSEPPAEYLDLLDELGRKNNLPVAQDGVTYVSRSRMPADRGAHAGEVYLCEVLESLGVRVVYPEAIPLKEQLGLYAGAKRLIFAEGSALHGRQLIGRIGQDIDVLVRRNGGTMAVHQLSPRCDSLAYVPAASRNLKFTGAGGNIVQHASLALYDLDVLFTYFESIGLPVANVWNQKAFEASRDAAILEWIKGIYQPHFEALRPSNSVRYLTNQLEASQLGHLAGPATDIISQYEAAK